MTVGETKGPLKCFSQSREMLERSFLGTALVSDLPHDSFVTAVRGALCSG
jgi:hypothetical protein